MTVHEIQDDGNNKKIHKVTGGPYGGIYVNRQFETLLEELFGVQRIQKFKEHPSDWLSLMKEFEGKNRGKRILDDSLMTNIRLPRSFVSMLNETQSSVMDSYGTKDVRLKNKEYLCLSSGMMKKLFNPVVERIKQNSKTLMKNRNYQMCKPCSLLAALLILLSYNKN